MNQLLSPSLENVRPVKETDTFTKTHDQEGRSVINEYTFIKVLGEGAYGKVKLAVQMDSSTKFAVKVIKKDVLKRRREMVRDERGRVSYKNAFDDVLREIAVMKKLNHQNIVRLHEVIDNSEGSKMYMVMDFAEKGQIIEFNEDDRVFYSLSDTPVIDEEELRSIFAQTIKGIQYLHVNGIVHRDIKPQNILQAGDGTIKIADFGLANLFGESDTLTKVEGTHHFMSPESLLYGQNGYSGKIADVWALGVSFFAFTFYKPPFDGEDLSELFDNIKTQELVIPEDRAISSELRDLLMSLLDKDPTKRITLEELQDHAWFHMSENKETLMSSLQAKPQEVTVTKEEIQNAITPFEKVVFMKKVCKKMITNFRRKSAVLSDSKQGTIIRNSTDQSTSNEEIPSSENLLLQPGQKQSSIAEGLEETLVRVSLSYETPSRGSQPIQSEQKGNISLKIPTKEAGNAKIPVVEVKTEQQTQPLQLEEKWSSVDDDGDDNMNVEISLKEALFLQPGQNQSSEVRKSSSEIMSKDLSGFGASTTNGKHVHSVEEEDLVVMSE